MSRILASLLLTACLLSLPAVGRKREPIRYVSADSVVVWSDGTDIQSRALAVDGQLRPRPSSFATPQGKRLRAVQQTWQRELLPQLNVVGSLGENLSHEPGTQAANVLYAALQQFPLDGQAQWFDIIERTLWNALLHQCAAPQPSADQHVAAQAIVDGMSGIYATDSEGLYVNLFVNSTAHICTDQYHIYIDQLTPMPLEGRVKIRLTSPGMNQRPLVLRIRIPEWAISEPVRTFEMGGMARPEEISAKQQGIATEGEAAASPMPQLYINGRAEEVPTANGYWVIARKWNSGDEVFFDLPMTPRFIRRTYEPGRTTGSTKRSRPVRQIAIQRGPLIYATSAAEARTHYFTKNATLAVAEVGTPWGNPQLAGSLFDDRHVPADASAPQTSVLLAPWSDIRNDDAAIWLREIR